MSCFVPLGIALRKVEERKAAAEASDKDDKGGSASGSGSGGTGSGGQSDVASILARRVAVEMSDSECDGQVNIVKQLIKSFATK